MINLQLWMPLECMIFTGGKSNKKSSKSVTLTFFFLLLWKTPNWHVFGNITSFGTVVSTRCKGVQLRPNHCQIGTRIRSGVPNLQNSLKFKVVHQRFDLPILSSYITCATVVTDWSRVVNYSVGAWLRPHPYFPRHFHSKWTRVPTRDGLSPGLSCMFIHHTSLTLCWSFGRPHIQKVARIWRLYLRD